MNIPGIAGLCEGIRFIIKEGAENIGAYEKYLSDSFRSRLMNMSGITVYGRGDTGITAFNIDGIPSEETAERLVGIIVRAGYHCAPLAHKALGTYNGGCVRVSFGYYNKPAADNSKRYKRACFCNGNSRRGRRMGDRSSR